MTHAIHVFIKYVCAATQNINAKHTQSNININTYVLTFRSNFQNLAMYLPQKIHPLEQSHWPSTLEEWSVCLKREHFSFNKFKTKAMPPNCKIIVTILVSFHGLQIVWHIYWKAKCVHFFKDENAFVKITSCFPGGASTVQINSRFTKILILNYCQYMSII